ncbi:MAG: HIT family protein [Planctomycetota bacterium]|jgi:ATP adenylyltransferase
MPPDNDTTQPGAPSVLHAPWRDVYMQELSSSLRDASDDPPGTFFEEYWRHPERDEANHVVARLGEGDLAGLILLNKYPYANGHLLVALAESRPTLMEYTPAQRASLWEMVDKAALLVTRALEPQGLNIGINQGTAAGAGVPGHLHAHVVPRWNGDVNFISVVGQIRVIPSALESMWRRYRDAWSGIASG